MQVGLAGREVGGGEGFQVVGLGLQQHVVVLAQQHRS